MSEANRLIQVASELVQVQGFERTQLEHISLQADIPLAEVKSYIRDKEALSLALIEYSSVVMRAQCQIIEQQNPSPKQKIIAFRDYFIEISLDPGKFCLCGMLAAEMACLSNKAHDKLSRYFAEGQAWLAKIFLQLGSEKPEEESSAYFAMMEGALLMARLEGCPDRLIEASDLFLNRYEIAA